MATLLAMETITPVFSCFAITQVKAVPVCHAAVVHELSPIKAVGVRSPEKKERPLMVSDDTVDVGMLE